MKGNFMSRDELEKVPVLDKAKLVAKILTTAAKGVSNVVCIPSNRCPLVRFVHNPTGKKVDLSLNNRFVLIESFIAKHYM
jgi:speckle targeted PIP5K1A-regulated poly(A) polymerase